MLGEALGQEAVYAGHVGALKILSVVGDSAAQGAIEAGSVDSFTNFMSVRDFVYASSDSRPVIMVFSFARRTLEFSEAEYVRRWN